jgi:ribosomal 30S subunit maturation factor RimM
MSILLELGNDLKGKLTIEILGRLYPTSTDCWDGNWLNTNVVVQTKEFNGKVFIKTLTGEYDAFYKNLMLLSESSNEGAEFATLEEQLYINIHRQQKGKYLLKGKLVGTRPDGGLLEFTFSLTEDDLSKLAGEIYTITKEYPIYGDPKKRK